MKPWENTPLELPDGRLVCRPHRLVICGSCTVDYSFMDEALQESDQEDLYSDDEALGEYDTEVLRKQLAARIRTDTPPGVSDVLDTSDIPDTSDTYVLRRGVGRVLPTIFVPPSSEAPQTLFPAGIGREAIPNVIRFIHRNDPKTLLIYTDGACINNGQSDPQAGWAFSFRPHKSDAKGYASGRLEHEGPFGDGHQQTSNRAELRAVIGALRFRNWKAEGFARLVLATDSEYVVKGATEWVDGWLARNWRTSARAPVKNRDLWETLLGEMERWDERGLRIHLWRIPREWNADADRAAKEGARMDDRATYRDIMGVYC
ncbi:hypothetical protein FAUST_11377 [Fusarium austroamericanum]|uniref:ribonuclease H n=1 Tax=Fusarium austroamericanum TaxID=282268 RepID=A0AAN5Z0J6_FUSAU|nr:hypothetical protein FAUST_11377 [Fusarium austroamericanum]